VGGFFGATFNGAAGNVGIPGGLSGLGGGFFGSHPPIPPPPSPGGFIAVGGGGAGPIIVTRDVSGVWTTQTAAAATFSATATLRGVARANGVVVIASSGDEIGTSTDNAVTVTQQTVPAGTFNFNSAGGDASIALCGGNGQQYVYSTDAGVTWQLTNLAGGGSYISAQQGIGAGGGTFAGTGISSGADNKLSADGVTWVAATSQNGGRAIIHDGTQFVIAGRGTQIQTSPDGDVYASSVCALDALSVAFNGTVYVVIEFFGNRLITAASIAGLAGATPQTVAAGNFTAITADRTSGLFVAIDDAGFAYSSPDGLAWAQETTGAVAAAAALQSITGP